MNQRLDLHSWHIDDNVNAIQHYACDQNMTWDILLTTKFMILSF